MKQKDTRKAKKAFLKENKLMLVMLILLVLSLSYIAYNEYNRFVYNSNQQLRQAAALGYQQGVVDTVQKLYKETETCQPVSIYLGNKTKNLISLDCLRPSPTNSTLQ